MKIAVFDFDGTITSKDTFLEFVKLCKGLKKFWCGMIILSPVILLYKMGVLNNGKAKQIVFNFFFKGLPLKEFNVLCDNFSLNIERILNKNAIDTIRAHQKNGDIVLIISASIENWIKPWAKKNGINEVLATKIEIDSNGCLTGYFQTANCYGREKKKRLLELFPNRKDYILFVYGDSYGDTHLMEIADFRFYKCFY